MKEEDFYNEVTKDSPDGPPYLLYQYPTAFLLAKDISMEFTGLSYGPINFGGSISASGSYNHKPFPHQIDLRSIFLVHRSLATTVMLFLNFQTPIT